MNQLDESAAADTVTVDKAFLLTLGDRLLREADIERILALTCEQLARRLDVSRVAFCELAEGIEVGLITTREWTNGVPPFSGSPQRWADLNPALTSNLEAGRVIVVGDIDKDPLVGDHPDCIAHEFSDHALIAVPLIRADTLVAYLLVANKAPRSWTEAELALVREVAVRTWETLERARAEAKLREREANQIFLLQLADVTRDEADPEAILLSATSGLKNHLRVADVVYRSVGPGEGHLAAPGEHAGFGPSPAAFSLDLDAASAAALAAGRTLRVNSVSEGAASGAAKAYVCVPLVKGGHHMGTLAVFHDAARHWSDNEVSLIEDVAERMWATLQRVRAEAELARSREALFQSEKLTALGSLLAGVSHELNNPLSVVVGQALMLEQKAADPETARRAAKIRNSAERCARIVHTFLAMARQRQPERQWASVAEIVDAAIELTSYGCRAAGIRVKAQYAADLPVMLLDVDQLHQVFTNLLINAQHALEDHKGPREIGIDARLAPGGGAVCIGVRDSGPGVPARYRHRIFEPFFTTKPVGSGTGLGLSYAHGVVEAHGGTLELLPSASGTSFEISLPVTGKPAQPASRDAAPAPRPKGVALIVDDEVEVGETLAEIVEGEGMRAVIETSGEKALDRLAAETFDLIISDVRMPGVGGAELHDWLALHRPAQLQRLAFLTGDTLGAGAARFLAGSGRPFAEKPFSQSSIRRLIAQVAEAAGND